jgi:mannosyltransferase
VPTALVAMGFFATFPTAVHYGREIRMYPLLTFLFLVSFVFFLAIYRSGQDRSDTTPRARALLPMARFSISLALTFYTHYTASILFMLYTLVGLYCLIRGEKAAFFWTFLGLAVATILTLPQLNHLFSSSLGDPDKSWMQATTFPIFYNISLGAYSYPAALKLPVLMVLVAGFGVLWMRNKTIAGILFLFNAGGMLLAAAIGVVEPIYLVRTIQIYTVFAGILVAVALLRLPRSSAILLGAGLLAANIYTVVQDQYLPERVPLLADRTAGFVDLLDPSRDQVFAKNYL